MQPVVAALKGPPGLVTRALKVLDTWIDSLNPEFLEPAMAPVSKCASRFCLNAVLRAVVWPCATCISNRRLHRLLQSCFMLLLSALLGITDMCLPCCACVTCLETAMADLPDTRQDADDQQLVPTA